METKAFSHDNGKLGQIMTYDGMNEAQILADFPDLTRDDLKACIAFAADRERKLITVPAA